MGCTCHPQFGSAVEHMFDHKVAASELRRYRRRGARFTTRMLRDAIRAHAPSAVTLLDVGAGVGALTFELLEAGVAQATVVDASSAFLGVGRDEAARRKVDARIEWRHADFVDVAPSLPSLDVVALDRVVCCYPAIDELLTEAASHARSCLAMPYPLERWSVRSVVSVQNAVRRLTGNAFQVFVHPTGLMEDVVRRQGFELVSRRGTLIWRADVYVRRRL
jgi:SAM-dependent methyltransferase